VERTLSYVEFENTCQPFGSTNKGINMCLYADNGTGKTALITSSPGLILQADPGGTTTAASMGREGRAKIITNWDDMDETLDYFRNGPGAKKYGWVWLDSVSVFQEIGLEDIMTQVVSRKPHRKVWHPDVGEYGENMNRLKLWVRHMCGVPVNFGFTAHPFRTEDEQTGEIQYLPWVQGKGMPNSLCGMVDVIAFMRIEEDHQVCHFKKRNMYYAKDRYGALPSRMVDPSLPKIEGLIKRRLAEMAKKEAAGNGKRPVKRVAKRAVRG
jgi:hypothetical protein